MKEEKRRREKGETEREEKKVWEIERKLERQ